MPQPSEVCDVSVVIPVHNGELYISDAIQSVLGQTRSACEVVQVIVVDNNSIDGTRAIVERLIADRPEARVMLARESRPNAANARNAGARLATGSWLAFLDADDLWLPEKLQQQIEARQQHPEVDLFFTLGEEFHSPELDEDERAMLPCRSFPYPLLTPSSLLLRREVFEQAGDLPDVPSGEFIAWYGWTRELGRKDFVVPEVLVRRRIHASNTTRGQGAMAGYPQAAKWLLDQRRQNQRRQAQAGRGL
jgi:glycosyltransferase involved in cell wall biosynthesis